ncbi:hypothetical protein AAIG33_04405 [Phytobacter ursingii]|uniref:hypothetical protein n=1 Tax=Phytobacter ursingii TaxID=1972431 RepID=UPI0031B76507
MKLIDLLVQELPKRGGWPVDNASGLYLFLEKNNITFEFDFDCAYFKNQHGDTVNRAQYEAALAASQKVEWDGIGIPRVGCECELSNAVEFYTHAGSTDFDEGTIVVVGGTVNFGLGNFVAVKVKGTNCITDINPCFLRPIRSEADKKRKETIDLMDKRFKEVLAAGSTEAMAIFATVYDTIAAGEMPGANIE